MSTQEPFRVDGLVAAITGGGTGIGFMMAKALAKAGAKKVYILGRRKETLEKAATEHESITPLVCDVTSKDSLRFVVDTITKDIGYVNLVVANSGAFGPTQSYDPSLSIRELRERLFDDVSMEEFTDTLNVNVTAAYFTSLAFLELLDAGNKNALKGGFGAPLREGSNVPSIQSQIIFTSSIAAFSRDLLSPPAYGSSKSALVYLTKKSSTNLAPYEIRANALAPGYFLSEMTDDIFATRDPGTESFDHPKYIPARRFGQAEEMEGTVLYLASRAGAFCNGLILLNDGGRLGLITGTY